MAQKELNIEELKKKKLFIATPMYGGQCAGFYTKSISDLMLVAGKYDIEIKLYFLFNESLITRARNYCVDEFLRSGYTHLMFIDSDIVFNWKDVLSLLDLCDSDEGRDIVAAPYPKKTIAWEKVKKAADAGFADENPFMLEEFTADYVFNPVKGIKSFSVSEMVEVEEAGTGFMIIDRRALDKYAEEYSEYRYRPDHARSEKFDGSHEITAFFDTVIDPESKRYLSEDYMFCKWSRKIGLKVWMTPWVKLKHIGMYVYGGSMGAIAAINASPTSSKESKKKNYLTPPTKSDSVGAMNRKQRRTAKKGN